MQQQCIVTHSPLNVLRHADTQCLGHSCSPASHEAARSRRQLPFWRRGGGLEPLARQLLHVWPCVLSGGLCASLQPRMHCPWQAQRCWRASLPSTAQHCSAPCSSLLLHIGLGHPEDTLLLARLGYWGWKLPCWSAAGLTSGSDKLRACRYLAPGNPDLCGPFPGQAFVGCPAGCVPTTTSTCTPTSLQGLFSICPNAPSSRAPDCLAAP